jgi:hypothetical protein
MPWTDAGPHRVPVDLPRAGVAVLQHDAEIARTPSQDLAALPSIRERRWDVRWFDERTFGGMLGEPSPYDVLIFGYNAIAFSATVRAALDAEPPRSPLVILHQLRPDDYRFLTGRLQLTLRRMPGGHTEEAFVPYGRERDEILLNFPATPLQDAGSLAARAINWFEFEPGSAWRVALEARVGARRLPVVVRTADTEPQRVVACSLLLRPEDERHAPLLDNIVGYAAAGWPELAVLDPERVPPEPGYAPEVITRKLRIQGARALRVKAGPGRPLDLGAWPLRGLRRVVLPPHGFHDLVTGEAADTWLAAGGTLVRMEPDGGVVLRAQAGDEHWIARRWAVWYSGCPPSVWQDSLFAARAVLRMLHALEDQTLEARRDLLGISGGPEAHDHAVASLLARRVRRTRLHAPAEGPRWLHSVDLTIGATAAALDVDRLVGGGALAPGVRAGLEAWLTDAWGDASLADRLDIARCLRRGDLFAEGLAASEARELSAVEATRLREAALAQDEHGLPDLGPGGEALAASVAGARVREGLRSGSLRCAELLGPWARCHQRDPGHPLSRLDDPRAADVAAAALDGLATSRALTDDVALAESDGHHLSVEAHALLRWLATQRQAGEALQVRPQSRELPLKSVASVLGEVQRAREQEQRAQRDVPAMGTAVLILGSLALAALAVAFLAVIGWRGVEIDGSTALAAGLCAVGAAVLLALLRWVALARRELAEPERRDVVFTRAVVTSAVLLGAAAALAYAWEQTSALAVALLVLVVAAGILGAVFLGLRSLRLAPRWTADLVAIIGEPRGLLEWVRRREARDRPPAPGP